VLGLIVVAGLGLGTLGVFAIGSRQGLWGGSFDIQASFPQINGVEVGTRVRVQGINAGQVIRITHPRERGGQVLVHLRLSDNFRVLIGSDARAEIVGEGLIGGKVIEIDPGSQAATPIEAGATIPGQSDRLSAELRQLAARSQTLMTEIETLTKQTARTMEEAQGLVREIRQGQGVVGSELVGSLRQFQQSMESMGRGFDALKHMPWVGQYVDTATDLLVRPGAERYRFVLKESDLFEPGRSVLTATGKGRLDALAITELPRLNVIGSEVVIAGYTQPGHDARVAEVLTQQQSEAVRNYLLEQYAIQKISFWRRRDVIALGMGAKSPPGGMDSSLPARRIEIIVFAPPGSVKDKMESSR
jgi:phospholipid/cholesterol/gamma-HCH transport system substrate-binding protein